MSTRDIATSRRQVLTQFLRFGLVGFLGMFVNQSVLVLQNVVMRDVFAIDREVAVWQIPFTDFNVRTYHLYVLVAFLVANFVNFMFNRYWTFRTGERAPLWHEYWPFLVVGLLAQGIGLLLITGFMHPDSFVSLPTSVFDDSSGLRNKLYWANIITICCVTPINFVLNRIWTFKLVRDRHAKPNELEQELVA